MSRPESPWTRENIVEALLLWAELYGRSPRSRDWITTTMPEPARSQAWPNANDVVRLFGSWNAGLLAAGFKPQTRWGWRPR